MALYLTLLSSSSQPAPLRIPEVEWRPAASPPGALLRAECGIVPFHGREKESAELHAWCMDAAPVGVRLYTGPEGTGRTRLALETARALRAAGWWAGFLEPETGRSLGEVWPEVSRPEGRVLAIVDEAETRREALVPLLRQLAAATAGPVRLLLLAHESLTWWRLLKEEAGVGELLSAPATSHHALRDLASTREERVASYHLARQEFARRLDLPEAEDFSAGLDEPLYDRALLLHMRALADLGEAAVHGEEDLLDAVLSREQLYWEQQVRARQLDPTLVAGVRRAMAAFTLGGGVDDEAETVDVLRRLQVFAGRPDDVLRAVARLLHECYGGERWIQPVRPDLLGEHLVQRELAVEPKKLFDLVLGPGA